jgi:hypothetical protein
MSTRVKLSDLMESLESTSQEGRIYYDRQGGRTVRIDRSLLGDMEDGNEEALIDVPDWQKPDIEVARAVLSDDSGRFIDAPDPFDFNEYRQMERFIEALPDATAVGRLWRSIKSRGAFRRFRETLYQLGIEKQWFEYREAAMKAFVIDWAESNGIDFEDDVPDKRP